VKNYRLRWSIDPERSHLTSIVEELKEIKIILKQEERNK